MNEEIKPTRPKREMIAISESGMARIDQYIAQINSQKPINLSRKAFLSWFLETGSENLSNKQVNAAIEEFYSTKDHLRHLLRKVAAAEASGEDGEFEIVFRPKKQELKKEASIENSEDET